MTPQHHDRDMYRDTYDGQDMKRWICTEPGCTAAIGDYTITALQEKAWADEHGIQMPGWTTLNAGPGTDGGDQA